MMNQNRFSVLAIPDSLTFYLNDENGCKQEIEVYNVHNFTINFKVLCTSVENYKVDPSHGSIRSMSKINITIQLKNHDFDRKKDTFKIDAYMKDNENIVGDKDIEAYILPEKPINDQNQSISKEEMKATKSDDGCSTSSSYKTQKQQLKSTTITLDNLQNLVIMSASRFSIYLILVFIVGMITGMIINAPQDIKLD